MTIFAGRRRPRPPDGDAGGSGIRPPRARSAPRLALVSVAAFWALVLLLGAVNPGYSQRRDYVSTLAAHGADLAWLGVVAIGVAAVAIIATALVLRPISRIAAVLAALAGFGFVVVAFSRLDCPKGPARCGLGGRFEVSGAAEITHSAATAVSAFLLVAAMAVSGLGFVRSDRKHLGRSSIAAAIVTAVAFLATGGSSPGWIERSGILVATAWMAVVALGALTRRAAD